MPRMRIAGRSWPGDEQNFSSAIQEYKRSANVRQPFQRTQGRETVFGNADKTFQPMANSGKSPIKTILGNPIFQDEVSPCDAHTNAVTDNA
jgi:hypothetical protein